MTNLHPIEDINILTGDININLLDDNDIVEDYKNILSYCGFSSYINKYTRLPSRSCLDHFFMYNHNKDLELNTKSFIFRYNLTDHCPIALTFQVQHNKNDSPNSYYKSYINYPKLREDLSNEKWANIFEEKYLDVISNKFIETLQRYINNNTKTVKVKNKIRFLKCWMTPGLAKSIKEKNILYQLTLKNPTNDNIKNRYKTYKNILQKLINKTKRDYLTKQINRNKNSSKSLWECVNTLYGKRKHQTNINVINLSDEDQLTEKQKIADAFNEYYANIGKKLAEKIPDIDNFTENTYPLQNTIFLKPTDTTEVISVIKNLKNKKSAGFDNIRSETLKEIASEVAPILTRIINKSFSLGHFPKCFKTGIIKPLFKTGDKSKIENYSPISILSNISKIIERVMKNRFQSFLNKYNILSDYQYGFREGRSTEDAILNLTSSIYDHIDKKTPAVIIFLDLSNAFDTVCHKSLLNKLETYGFRGLAYDLLKSYLSDREQSVEINGTFSTRKKVTFGVPQGTLTLTLNHKKSCYLPFTSYSSSLPNLGSLNIGYNQHIPESENVKYLGVTIDRHLRWEPQVKNILNKIRGLIPKFKYLRDFLTISHLKTLYYSLVESLLNYGILGWGGVFDVHLNHLNVTQKWILKVISKRSISYPTEELYKECRVCDVRQ